MHMATDINRPQRNQDAVALEALARQRLSGWWNRADRHSHYPATDEDAVELCLAAEYAIDLDTIEHLADMGAFDPPPFRDSRRIWSATDISRLAFVLECRRAWQSGSELHASKKTPYEVALEQYRASGEQSEMFHDLQKFDLRSLLLMLTECDNRQQREILYVAIQVRLETDEGVVV